MTLKATQTKLPFRSVHVFPQFSVLDPTKTYTLPTKQMANGLVDAFVHITEQYLTYPVQALAQDRFAEGLLQTLVEIAPQAMAAPEDYATRSQPDVDRLARPERPDRRRRAAGLGDPHDRP